MNSNEHHETGEELESDGAPMVEVAMPPPGFAGGGDGARSELRAALLADFGGATFSPAVCDELLDALAERGDLRGSRAAAEAPADGKWRALAATLLKIMAYIVAHPSQNAIFAALYVQNVPMLDDILGGLNQQQFAETLAGKTTLAFRDDGTTYSKQLEQTKAAVNNAVKDAQKHFQRPPRDDQRTADTCAKQSAVRKGQLVNA